MLQNWRKAEAGHAGIFPTASSKNENRRDSPVQGRRRDVYELVNNNGAIEMHSYTVNKNVIKKNYSHFMIHLVSSSQV